jgi:AraC-like DNA-binding protein
MALPQTTPGSLRVLYANQLVIDQRWVWRLSDPFWRLYFNRDSGAAISNDQQRWELPPYRAVLVPAWGDFHGTCVAPVRHFYIHFEAPGLNEAWTRRYVMEPLILDEDPLLRSMLDELARVTQPQYPTSVDSDGRWRIPDRPSAPTGLGWHLRLQSTVAWAMAQALTQLGPDADPVSETSTFDPLEPALQWIETHLADPLSVSALARRCQLSADHFAKRFTAATARTPMRYVQERRITTAAERLLRTGDPIERVARDCGFANRFHFSRVFTQLIGTPPAQYRQQHR